MKTKTSFPPRLPLSLLAVVSTVLLALVGCESTPGASSAPRAVPAAGGTALPLQVLDQIYAARTAMTGLADGSAADPVAAKQAVAGALPAIQAFTARVRILERSFNSADWTQLWEQLSQMGSFYRIDTSVFSASELRRFESNYLRSFRGEVNDLERQLSAYEELYGRLMVAVGADFSIPILQQNIPAINQLTTDSVNLDKQLRQFSATLTGISSALDQARMGERFGG